MALLFLYKSAFYKLEAKDFLLITKSFESADETVNRSSMPFKKVIAISLSSMEISWT